MDFNFTPTSEASTIDIPYIEDARADFAPYYAVEKNWTENKAKDAVIAELSKLGAGGVVFQEGYFGSPDTPRNGYIISFWLGGARGILRVAGLPARVTPPTATKLRQIRIQALLNVRDWLKSAVTTQVFTPGTNALMTHLLVGDTDMTIGEYIATTGELPQIAPPATPLIQAPRNGNEGE